MPKRHTTCRSIPHFLRKNALRLGNAPTVVSPRSSLNYNSQMKMYQKAVTLLMENMKYSFICHMIANFKVSSTSVVEHKYADDNVFFCTKVRYPRHSVYFHQSL